MSAVKEVFILTLATGDVYLCDTTQLPITIATFVKIAHGVDR